MLRFSLTFIVLLAAWIVLTFPYSFQEMIAGILVSAILSVITKDFMFHSENAKPLDPRRWIAFIGYVILWIWLEIKSHLEVIAIILTGKTRPAIVKVPTSMKTDVGKTLLGNSITLTPGTLTVSAGSKNLFVHCLRYRENTKPGKCFEKIGRRLVE